VRTSKCTTGPVEEGLKNQPSLVAGDSIVAFGNDELEKRPPLAIGDSITCPHCGQQHVIQGGKDQNGCETDFLLFYTCNNTKKSYLAGVKGKNVMPVFQARRAAADKQKEA